MPNLGLGVVSDFTFSAKFICSINLEVGFRNCYNWTVLPIIMECSPYLEFLALEKEVLDEDQFVCDEWLRRWREPEPVPKGMLNCLKVIGIKGFQGKQYELTVVKFLLGNAEVLEKMVICSPPLSSDEETMLISETIFGYPRGSKDCQIIFLSDS
ncbi:hypothetical protein CUMW_157720 [Citrus unshiu]|uniref:FBD domain-containing protein n=1 Tax=Citrus sinensis TaxID=2711 RepID=A0A067EBF3_CITSI|nr:putative F-box/FBD/LRR-repeat protein At4g26350 [Citrus sinensis]KDO48552.1 hypothetical protein CISIN_1g037298mg [Citrus sinensis]GAY54571.1 hypothetical protein CUMW_157720 [Citrus unshiu]